MIRGSAPEPLVSYLGNSVLAAGWRVGGVQRCSSCRQGGQGGVPRATEAGLGPLADQTLQGPVCNEAANRGYYQVARSAGGNLCTNGTAAVHYITITLVTGSTAMKIAAE